MRILVVDDNDQIRSLVKLGLEAETFTVDSADNGLDGSFLARTNDYDLVILDNVMPKKHGVEVCKDIRAAGKKMPIIMLSALTETNKKVELLGTGADDYMTKPFSFEELMARIRALLRRPHISLGEEFELGDIKLNSTNQEVYVSGKIIYLTKKEFSLLEFLLRNQGKIVSRGMIMEHIWDLDADPFSNTIETHIWNLRKKIEHGRKRLIHNIPGRGYKIAVTA